MLKLNKYILLVLGFVLISSSVVFAEEITIAGTGDSEKILGILAQEYAKKHPDAKILVPPSIGSGGGVKAVAEGQVAIGRIARPLQESEMKYNLKTILFARSPVSFVANNSITKVKNISSEQAIALYSGKITNWKDLGGPDQKLYLIVRERGDSSTLVLIDGVPGFGDIKELAGKIGYSTPEAADLISKNKFTLGYLPMGMVDKKTMKVMSFNGVDPSPKNVADEKYKLFVPQLFVYKDELKGLAKDFVEFVSKDPTAQKILKEHGFYAAKSK